MLKFIWKDTGDATTYRFFIIDADGRVFRLGQDRWNAAHAAATGPKGVIILVPEELAQYANQFPGKQRALLLG